MPLSFQIGLFCTVATLAWVRLLKSLRALGRVRRPSVGRYGAAGTPGSARAALTGAAGTPGSPASGGSDRAALAGAAALVSEGTVRPDATGVPSAGAGGSDARGRPGEPSSKAGRNAEGDARGKAGGTKGSRVEGVSDASKAAAVALLATGGRQSAPFNWERWFHLATLCGLVLFGAPFLFGVASPRRMAAVSASVDATLSGGAPVPGVPQGDDERALAAGRSVAAPAPAGRLEGSRRLERLELADERRAAWAILLGCGAVAALFTLAGGYARRKRLPRVMCAFASLGLAAAAAGFILAGPAAGRLSGARRAGRTIEEYARAPRPVPSGKAGAGREGRTAVIEGPVRLEGIPEASPPRGPAARPGSPKPVARPEAGFLFRRTPGDDARNGSTERVRSGFRVDGVEVGPGTTSTFIVARPHVDLGPGGRELFIRADEPVVVLGWLEDGRVRPRPGYRVVVTPASGNEARLFRTLARDLLGTAPARRRYLALFQIVFGALAAYTVMVLLASGTELIVSLRARRAALTATTARCIPPAEPVKA